MSIQSAADFSCGKWGNRDVIAKPVESNLSSDAGLLLYGQFDSKLGWTSQFSRLISDARIGPEHSVLSIVRQRVFGILAGYEDQNDHDTLRSDPVFKLLADRAPEGADLASQPTISRLENSVKAADLLKMEQWFIDKFVESIESIAHLKQVTLDIDTYDDQAHGSQQLTFWHDYYKQNQYQVRVITCAENDMVVFPVLLFGCASAKLGAAEDLERVIKAIRARYPQLPIRVRADSGFGGPDVYETLESFDNVEYTIAMKMNNKIIMLSQELFEATVAAQAASGLDELRYMSVCDYTSKKWSKAKRQVVIKCEVTAHSTMRRAVLSNRPEVMHDPELVYREYAQRGESENRNKELKCGLSGDRLSDHRYMANLFRLMMHCLSYNLLASLRRLVALPAPESELKQPSREPNQPIRETKKDRKRHNDRRRRDPLGEGHACTWRTHVIKVAGRISVSTRRVVLTLSASWPHLNYFQRVATAIEQLKPRLI